VNELYAGPPETFTSQGALPSRSVAMNNVANRSAVPTYSTPSAAAVTTGNADEFDDEYVDETL
jgi:hypothetical protein